MVYPQFAGQVIWWVMAVAALTAGCIFLMWLGEQIDEYGLGNGVSLIILAGIVARMPRRSTGMIRPTSRTRRERGQAHDTIGQGDLPDRRAFVFVVAGSILITAGPAPHPDPAGQAHARPPVYGGQKQYLPLRVNHGGVMPIIFASSLMLFPAMLFGWLRPERPVPGLAALFGFLNERIRIPAAGSSTS